MSKRGENIYKRKDGRWEGRYLKPDKKYSYIYGNTYKEVKEKLNAAKVNLKNKSGKTKISVLCDKWLEYKEQYIKESSFVKYKNIAEKYIKPYFEKIPANKVDEYVIETFVKYLSDRGYSSKTVKITLAVLEGVFSYSKIKIDFSFNRFIPKPEQKEIHILTEKELIRLERYLSKSEDPCKIGVLTALYTGIRIGELCALKWENIDLANGFIRIAATLQRIQDFKETSDKKTKIIITEPKTPSAKRIIPLPNLLINKLKCIKPKTDKAFLLTGNERFIEPRMLNVIFKKYLKECGIDDINFHSLRHTFTTRCIETDFEPKALSEILGHSSVNTTLGIYTHPSLEYKRENINRLYSLQPSK